MAHRQAGTGVARPLRSAAVGPAERRRTALALLPLAVLGVSVGVAAYWAFDPAIAGDHQAHVDYLAFIRRHHRLPLAEQGFEMYHPPAYYVLSVLVSYVGLSLTDAARTVATAAWALEGLLAAVVVARLGGRWVGGAAAAGVVWLLPGQANVATRVYPETLVGLGVGLLVLGMVELRRQSRTGYWWLGLGVPLAGLTKFSGLVALAVVLPLVVWSERARLRRLAAVLAPGLALMALFYGRNVAHYGTPTPLNADLFHLDRLGGLYAAYPEGFFTRLSLGRCAAERSFYGSAWKWLWATDCGVKPPWRDSVDGWLLVVALLTSLVVLVAWLWAARTGRRHGAWAAIALVPLALLVAFIAYNVRVPSGSSGLYLLVGIVPVAVALGGFASRVPMRFDMPVYAATLGWAAAMATASGAPVYRLPVWASLLFAGVLFTLISRNDRDDERGREPGYASGHPGKRRSS